MDENELSRIIIGAAIEVHQVLGGSGLLEGVYAESLGEELSRRGIPVDRELQVPLVYKGKQLRKTNQLDLLVGGLVVVEVKSVEKLNPLALSQCLTYLRLTGKRLGLVINFGEKYVKYGIHRIVNGL